MEKRFKYGLALAVVAIGVLLLFIHIGIFVFIYLPACLVLALILVVRSRRAPRKPKVQGLEKPKPEAKMKVVKVPKYPKVRKTLGAVVLVTILVTVLFPYLTEASPGPFAIVVFIDPMFASFVYPGIITGLYLLKSKRVRRLLGVALLIIASQFQLMLGLVFLALLIEQQPVPMCLLPMLILVPASTIYSAIEPAKKQELEREAKTGSF